MHLWQITQTYWILSGLIGLGVGIVLAFKVKK